METQSNSNSTILTKHSILRGKSLQEKGRRGQSEGDKTERRSETKEKKKRTGEGSREAKQKAEEVRRANKKCLYLIPCSSGSPASTRAISP
ncbi:hypothetical protein ACLB2K_058912 [Fragaria x ananassa]